MMPSILYGKISPLGPFALCVALMAGGCSQEQAADRSRQPSTESYVVGLGEIMGQTQMRHAKLWFAGQAGNWPLAAYELDELKEGFDDAVKYHPHHKSVPQPLSAMVPQYMGSPLNELDAAIKAKSADRFKVAFDHFTMGCNGCHMAADFGFNVVKRPTVPPFSNQDFDPRPSGSQ